MTWREKTVARILLIVALLVAEDTEIRRQIETLANHIAYGERES